MVSYTNLLTYELENITKKVEVNGYDKACLRIYV